MSDSPARRLTANTHLWPGQAATMSRPTWRRRVGMPDLPGPAGSANGNRYSGRLTKSQEAVVVEYDHRQQPGHLRPAAASADPELAADAAYPSRGDALAIHRRARGRRPGTDHRAPRLPADLLVQRLLQLRLRRRDAYPGPGPAERLPLLHRPAAAAAQRLSAGPAAGGDGCRHGRYHLRPAAPPRAALVGGDAARAAGPVRFVRTAPRAYGHRGHAVHLPLHCRHRDPVLERSPFGP